MRPSTFYGKNPCVPLPIDSDAPLESSSDSEELKTFSTSSNTSNESENGEASLEVPQTPPVVVSLRRNRRQPCETSDEDSDAYGAPAIPNPYKVRRRYLWKKSSRVYDFVWEKPQVEEINSNMQPVDYFRYYFDDVILEKIVEESNLYALQQNPNKPLRLTKLELEKFIGTVLYMCCASLPNTRLHWSKVCRNNNVAEVLSRERWEEIKENIHFNDNSHQPSHGEPHFDRMFKIRPLVTHLQQKVQRPPKSEYLSIDEQIVPYKGHHSCKQYIPKKPKKWGYKIFVLTDDKGIVYNFDIYCGQIKPVNGFADIGASGNIVLQLAKIVPTMKNYKLFFDNWFTSMPLMCELAKVGIQAVGTVRPNRVPNISLPTDLVMKKKGRGTYEERSTQAHGINVRAVKFFDKRSVMFLTTYAGVLPTLEKQKYDSKQKKMIQVPIPAIVNLYNSHMGGVDRLDHLIALYRSIIRSKKFYHKIFFHFIDMMCASGWQEYKEDCRQLGMQKREIKTLFVFKTEIAESFCKQGKGIAASRGRPSASVQAEHEKKTKRGPAKAIPCASVRLDQVGHFPTFAEKKGRCKMPTCKGITKVQCIKCKLHFCFTPNNNCFLKFHTT